MNISALRSRTVAVTALVASIISGLGLVAVPSPASAAPLNIQAASPAVPSNAPTNLVANPGAGTASISWTRPTNSGGALITAFRVLYSTDATFATGVSAIEVLGSRTYVTLTGLQNSTTYYAKVAARTSAGVGAYSAPASVTTIAVPAALTGLAVSPNLQGLAVRWNTPAVPALATAKITGYRVDYSTSPTFATYSSTSAKVVTSATTAAKISGLQTNVTYYVRAAAINAAGTGSFTDTVSGTPIAVPDVPTNVAAVAAAAVSGKITVTWKAPTVTGGAPVNGFVIDYSTTPDFTPSTTGHSEIKSGTAVRKDITGLEPSTLYYVRVAAKNVTGSGGYSSNATVSTINMPSAPRSLVVTPTVRGLYLTWSAPASLAGRTVTNYVVTYSRNEDMSGAKAVVLGRTATNADLANLTVGATYYVRVATQASQGPGASARSTAVPVSSAVAPQIDQASGISNETMYLQWSPSPGAGINGGTGPDAVVGYRIQYSTDSTFSSISATVDTGANLGDYTASSLTPGTYYVRIAGLTSEGAGAWSDVSTVTVTGLATAPRDVVASVTSKTSAQVTWTAPANNGGLPITGYTVTVDPDSNATVLVTGTSAVITGLTTGHLNTFTVAAVTANGAGASFSSSATLIATAPATPAAPALSVAGLQSLTASWAAPADNGSPVSTYRVQYSTDSTFATSVQTVDVNATSYTITGLIAGQTVYVKVSASNALGFGATSVVSSAAPGTAPSAPTGVSASRNSNTSANVSWSAPASNGYAITSYTVTATPSVGAPVTQSSATTSATLTGLSAGSTYTFTVTATNALGESSQSVASAPLLLAAVPAAPANVTATVTGLTTATVAWTAPANNGSAITSYTVTASPSAGVTITYPADRTTTGATLTGLTTGTVYTFSVVATNAIGTGLSGTSTDTLVALVPSAPAGFAVTAANTGATLTWNSTASNGGSPITSYRISYATNAAFTTGVTTLDTGNDSTYAFVSGLTNGTTYYFRLAATNGVGTGAWAAAATGAPAAVTGVLDTSFATSGAMAVLTGPTIYGPDGKFYVARASQSAFQVARYNANGVIDNSYGTSGVASVTTNGGVGNATVNSLVIDKQGRLVVGGTCFYNSVNNNSKACVARYTTTGQVDTTFQTYGWKTVTLNGSVVSAAMSVGIQSSGRIVIAANDRLTTSGSVWASCLTRLNEDGSTDTTFATSGKYCGLLGKGNLTGSWTSSVTSMAVSSDDSIAVGSMLNGASTYGALSKFTADGVLDTTFSGDGSDTVAAGTFTSRIMVAFQSTGHIIVASAQGSTSTSTQIYIQRYKANGTYDTAFGTSGTLMPATTALASYADPFAMAVEKGTDKILFSQYEGGAQSVHRFTATTGAADATFGSGGAYTASATANGVAYIAIGPDGRYTLVGTSGMTRIK
jgi:uncharacterized delta-60 repeat protein